MPIKGTMVIYNLDFYINRLLNCLVIFQSNVTDNIGLFTKDKCLQTHQSNRIS